MSQHRSQSRAAAPPTARILRGRLIASRVGPSDAPGAGPFPEENRHVGDEQNRVTQRSAAANRALLRRLTRTLVPAHPAELSVATKRFAAARDPDVLEEALRGDGILEKQ